jgi:hypothetical protein
MESAELNRVDNWKLGEGEIILNQSILGQPRAVQEKCNGSGEQFFICASAHVLKEWGIRASTFVCAGYFTTLSVSRSFIQGIRPGPRLLENFRNKLIFYGEELLAPRPGTKLKDHPLPAVRDCLFNIFAATRACSTNGGEEECI